VGRKLIACAGIAITPAATAVDEYTNQVFIRARARQMALKISSTDIGVKWQMGSPRVDARPSGRR
jgi:hypothetical protein